MKQKIKQTLMAIVGLLLNTTAFAHHFYYNGIYYNITSSYAKTLEVTYEGGNSSAYSNEYSGTVTIPSSVIINGVNYSVTSIGDWAFENCSGLTEVTIPNSVTEIGEGAFMNCSGLTEVNYNAENCISMGSYYFQAFSGCNNLKTINIGNNVKTIPNRAFEDCTSLTSVTIPNSVTEIGFYAFFNTGWYNNLADGILYLDNCCLGYKGNKPTGSLSLTEDTRLIANSAFGDCTGLTSVTIPNSVTSIGDYAFQNCTGLTEVTIGNSVTSIGRGAFRNCNNLKSVINLSNLTLSKGSSDYGYIAYYANKVINVITDPNASTVEDFVFYKADNVNILVAYLGNATKLILPTDFNGENYEIDSEAFMDCTGLTEVSIPKSVTSIRSHAFYGCSGLTSLTIGSSTTWIGDKAFYNCGLRLIISYCMLPPTCADGAFDGNPNNSYSALLKVPEGSDIKYAVADEWYKFGKIQEIIGVEGVETDNNTNEVARYDIHGRLLSEPSHGINIVKYSDGTTRKEIVKE